MPLAGWLLAMPSNGRQVLSEQSFLTIQLLDRPGSVQSQQEDNRLHSEIHVRYRCGRPEPPPFSPRYLQSQASHGGGHWPHHRCSRSRRVNLFRLIRLLLRLPFRLRLRRRWPLP
jgi:hypothetical protein